MLTRKLSSVICHRYPPHFYAPTKKILRPNVAAKMPAQRAQNTLLQSELTHQNNACFQAKSTAF
jgi:hypothetical protein